MKTGNSLQEAILKEYLNFGKPEGKFDMELLQIFQKVISLEFIN
jgi:hypothetical protein